MIVLNINIVLIWSLSVFFFVCEYNPKILCYVTWVSVGVRGCRTTSTAQRSAVISNCWVRKCIIAPDGVIVTSRIIGYPLTLSELCWLAVCNNNSEQYCSSNLGVVYVCQRWVPRWQLPECVTSDIITIVTKLKLI